jgi:hypothetical protein
LTKEFHPVPGLEQFLEQVLDQGRDKLRLPDSILAALEALKNLLKNYWGGEKAVAVAPVEGFGEKIRKAKSN